MKTCNTCKFWTAIESVFDNTTGTWYVCSNPEVETRLEQQLWHEGPLTFAADFGCIFHEEISK